MKKTNILYIGRHLEITDVVVRLINTNEDWMCIGVIEDNKAVEFFSKIEFSIVLLGSGISIDEELALSDFFINKNPKIKIIQHYGGGGGLLRNEILNALC